MPVEQTAAGVVVVVYKHIHTQCAHTITLRKSNTTSVTQRVLIDMHRKKTQEEVKDKPSACVTIADGICDVEKGGREMNRDKDGWHFERNMFSTLEHTYTTYRECTRCTLSTIQASCMLARVALRLRFTFNVRRPLAIN